MAGGKESTQATSTINTDNSVIKISMMNEKKMQL